MYLAGPYLLGITAAAPGSSATLPSTPFAPATADHPVTVARLLLSLTFLFYFTLPANLMVYGVNDICDYETDRVNPKKTDYEALVGPAERPALVRALLICSLPFVPLLAFAPVTARAFLAAFVFLSVFYSAPPIRAKARPLIDSAFNILYAMPGFFAYALAGVGVPSWHVVAAAACWTMAMHAFSAVPDITADLSAGIATAATLLGRTRTITVCLLLYAIAAALEFHDLGGVALALGAVYMILMTLALRAKASQYAPVTDGPDSGVMRIYRWFPAINTVSGAVIFVTVFFSKHLSM